MTVITGNKSSVVELMDAADAKSRCTMCDKSLTVPYMTWNTWGRIKRLFICSQCCEWIKHGFVADLQGVINARTLLRMGFNNEKAQRAAISGGFLHFGANDKQ